MYMYELPHALMPVVSMLKSWLETIGIQKMSYLVLRVVLTKQNMTTSA